MAQGQLIATLDCITQEIILDVQGGTAIGDFEVTFPDATTQTISGTLPLTVTSILDGAHVFTNTLLDPSSSVTSLLPITLDVDYSNCAEIEDMSYCLFNLNNAYEKALCKNEKLAEIEKQKLDRAIQLVLLMEHLTECSENQTGCNVYGCTDSTMFNYNPNACMDDGSCIPIVLGCTDDTMFNYNSNANTDDGSCIPFIYGCTDPPASNYNASANTDDGSCTYPTASWDCDGMGNCSDPGTGLGQYPSYAICQTVCTGSSTPCSGNLYVPDDDFEAYLENNGMGNGTANDDYVLKSNICNVTDIDIPYWDTSNSVFYTIESLTGIEGFINLTNLQVGKQKLSGTLDLTSNPLLESIRIGPEGNLFTSINVSQCTNLKTLMLYDAGLGSGSGSVTLDLTNNQALEYISLGRNNIDSIPGLDNLPNLISCSVDDINTNNLDLSGSNLLEGFWMKNAGNITVTLSSTLDLTVLTTFNTLGGYQPPGITVKVGAGDVPGTTGGSGAGGLQTRVEYMVATFGSGASTQTTLSNVTFTI